MEEAAAPTTPEPMDCRRLLPVARPLVKPPGWVCCGIGGGGLKGDGCSIISALKTEASARRPPAMIMLPPELRRLVGVFPQLFICWLPKMALTLEPRDERRDEPAEAAQFGIEPPNCRLSCSGKKSRHLFLGVKLNECYLEPFWLMIDVCAKFPTSCTLRTLFQIFLP